MEPNNANTQAVINATAAVQNPAPTSSTVTAQPVQSSPLVMKSPQPDIDRPADAKPEALLTNINVDSIISEMTQDLNSGLKESDIVSTQESNAEQIQGTKANTVTFNATANDTFKENYGNLIQMGKEVEINSSDRGVKEIKPTESLIVSQVVPPDGKLDNLEFKNYTLAEILTEAIARKASDVHLTSGYRATLRIDGELKTFNSPILTNQNIKAYASEIIRQRKDIDLENIKEADLTYSIGNKRFRINIFKQMGSYAIVCRVINENIASIESLGLPPLLNTLSNFANGLILLTGPTGSGKSTTLASLLNTINLTKSKHIVTLEDPVEYLLPKGLSVIDQREFGIDFTSWPNALRSVLRQDPDIVLIGEMRDLESIEAALQVAETGHLVFATLHTNSAAQSIDRIIDVFPADKQDQIRIQLASVLRAVVSQRLIPLAQGGRQPAVELVIVNTAIQNAIRENKVFLIDNVIQTSAEEGMISLEKSLVQMVHEGKISAQTAKSFSIKPNEIDTLLNR